MARCPSCGASSFLGLHTKQCAFCGIIVCNKCVPTFVGLLSVKVNHEIESSQNLYRSVGFCSTNCWTQFWRRVIDYQMDYDIGTNVENFLSNLTLSWNNAIRNAFAQNSVARAMADKAVQIHTRQIAAFPWWDSSGKHLGVYQEFKAKARVALAQNLEKCGRTADAAKVFEELRMYDKARELREQDRHIVVKKTDVSINLNSLLQQVREGGIVAVFRCPHCGGKLKIESKTTLNSLKTCEHCGSEIESMDLAEFLRTVLS
jgi:hypothetical protein